MAKEAPKKSLVSDGGFTRVSQLAGIELGEHDDLPITRSTGSITGLDGGFSETAALDKIHVPIGSKVIGLIVMEAVSHEYDRVTDGSGKNKETLDEFVENTVYKGHSVLLIDPDEVEVVVAMHQARINEARAIAAEAAKAARGESTLPGFGAAETAGGAPNLRSVPDDDGFHDPEVDGEDAPNPLVPRRSEG